MDIARVYEKTIMELGMALDASGSGTDGWGTMILPTPLISAVPKRGGDTTPAMCLLYESDGEVDSRDPIPD